MMSKFITKQEDTYNEIISVSSCEDIKIGDNTKKDGYSNNVSYKFDIPEEREKPKTNIFEAMLLMTK